MNEQRVVFSVCTPTAVFIQSTVLEELAQKVRMSYAVVKTMKQLQEIDEDFVKITVFDPQEKG